MEEVICTYARTEDREQIYLIKSFDDGKMTSRLEFYKNESEVETKIVGITPKVAFITFDAEEKLFLIRERLEFLEGISTNLSFYIDCNGHPVGFGAVDGFSSLFPLEFAEMNDESYLNFKEELKETLKREIITKRSYTQMHLKQLLKAYKE